MKDIHPLRVEILAQLLFSQCKRFSELKPKQMEGSQFTYHLEDLLKQDLVKQNTDGSYSLTEKGKEFANRHEYNNQDAMLQAKHSVVVCPIRADTNQLLVYTRRKNPFYGCQGFMTGKVRYGESIIEAAKREFKEETNLEGEPVLRAIRHYRMHEKGTDKLLEDKVMYIHIVINPTGDLAPNQEGDFFWVHMSDMKKTITNPLEEFWEVYELITTKEQPQWFKESIHVTDKF